MATITPTKLAVNVASGTLVTDLSTLAGATEHEITVGKEKNLGIYVSNTAAQKDIVFKASDFGVAAGIGDLTMVVNQNIPNMVSLEGSRFVNDENTIEFTVEAGATGSIAIFELPD